MTGNLVSSLFTNNDTPNLKSIPTGVKYLAICFFTRTTTPPDGRPRLPCFVPCFTVISYSGNAASSSSTSWSVELQVSSRAMISCCWIYAVKFVSFPFPLRPSMFQVTIEIGLWPASYLLGDIQSRNRKEISPNFWPYKRLGAPMWPYSLLLFSVLLSYLTLLSYQITFLLWDFLQTEIKKHGLFEGRFCVS